MAFGISKVIESTEPKVNRVGDFENERESRKSQILASKVHLQLDVQEAELNVIGTE